MGSFSIDDILRRARALSLEAGVDPDQPGADGKPEWFRFILAARESLRHDQRAQDPLALLREIEKNDHAAEAAIAESTASAESLDPLETLRALYEKETASVAHALPDLTSTDHAASRHDVTPEVRQEGASIAGVPHADPLEALRQWEEREMGADTPPEAGAAPLADGRDRQADG
jgi:hypothetical protein